VRQPQEFETYLRDRTLLPELRAVSWVTIDKATRHLADHVHDAYEITYVLRGRMDHRIGDRAFRIEAGQVFVTPPRVAHGGVDAVLHRNQHGIVHVAFPRRGLPGLAAEEARALARAFAAMAPGVFAASREVPDLIARILAEHRAPDAPFARLRARGALYELLALLVRDWRGAPRAAAATSPPIHAALAWLDEHLGESVAFDALARRVGLSPTHFRRLFAREVGESPGEHLARRRVERAKELLSRGASVTDVAFRLGFPSSQYFATVFKRFAGLTPKEHRARR
jgi:AraC-like DNA-binding protein